MGKSKNTETGFSAIEGLLILIIIGIVGFAGWYVYDAHKKANATYNAASQSSTSTAKAASSTARKFLVIKEWSVKLTVDSSAVASPVYNTPVTLPDGNQEVVLGSATWDSLTCQGSGSTLNIKKATGVGDELIRGTDQSKVLADQAVSSGNVIKVGDYYYTYQNNTGIGSCTLSTKDAQVYQAVNQAYTANWNANKVTAI